MPELSDLPAVDTTSPEPSRTQIANILRDAIKSGRFKPGDALPSRKDLRAHFGVSNATAGAALDTLKQEGFVVGRQGSGVFVRPDITVDLEPIHDREWRQIVVLVLAAGGEIRVPEKLLVTIDWRGVELKQWTDPATGDQVVAVRPK